MTADEWLQSAVRKLRKAAISTARLDAELLLCHVLQADRSWLLAHTDVALTSQQLQDVEACIEKRLCHIPIAYIIGRSEFYGREFHVNEHTLQPRPETETMVEIVLDTFKDTKQQSIVDIGTGSGCIIITLALELHNEHTFSGYDISPEALDIAKKNAKELGAAVDFHHFDLRTDKMPLADIIVANLPYVPNDFKINLAATHEPPFAIYGGEDGLDYYRLLFSNASDKTHTAFTESLPTQHKKLEEIARSAGFSLKQTRDFIQQFARSM